MPTLERNGEQLLQAVKQMPRAEFEDFIEKAWAERAAPRSATLSSPETKLIRRINLALPARLRTRLARLIGRRRKGTLTAGEHQQLLELTHEAESRDADRAAALVELAKLRRVPVRVLMKQLGIKPPAIHG
jgi:hypothetical protein